MSTWRQSYCEVLRAGSKEARMEMPHQRVPLPWTPVPPDVANDVPPHRCIQQRRSTSHTLKPLPCWGLVHSAGELLQTPERNSTSMTNNLRLKTNGHLSWYWVSEHLSIVIPCPMHPSSPVLLTRNGPHRFSCASEVHQCKTLKVLSQVENNTLLVHQISRLPN